jgi:hypothetical protein
VKINNFLPWRPVLKQLPPPRSKKLAAEIDPLRSSTGRLSVGWLHDRQGGGVGALEDFAGLCWTHVIEGHVERPDQRDERHPSARQTPPPNLCGKQGSTVTLHDAKPIRIVSKRLSPVTHLAGAQEAEID